jgi:outer membrane lipoprotein SlyB
VAKSSFLNLTGAATIAWQRFEDLQRGREESMRAVAFALLAALALAGCAHPSGSTYETGDVGRTIETSQGSVVSSRVVKITGETNAAGPLAGGALGAAGSALAFQGSGLVAVIGGVIGAGIGYLTQKQLNNRDGIEYVLEMDDGRTVTLVQNRAANEAPLPDGTPVLVQVGGQHTRVIADPRAERVGGADWVDPDTVPEKTTPAVGGSPVGKTGDPTPFTEPPAVSDQQ